MAMTIEEAVAVLNNHFADAAAFEAHVQATVDTAGAISGQFADADALAAYLAKSAAASEIQYQGQLQLAWTQPARDLANAASADVAASVAAADAARQTLAAMAATAVTTITTQRNQLKNPALPAKVG
jgi:hypothetical protein